jgi:hypothetical protein
MKWYELKQTRPQEGQRCLFHLVNDQVMSGYYSKHYTGNGIALRLLGNDKYCLEYGDDFIIHWCDFGEFMAEQGHFKADPVTAERGAVKVTLPGPDLFSMLEEVGQQVEEPQHEAEPVQRKYTRNGRRMEEHAAVEAAQKIGRAQGFSSRTDIERSIVRVTGRTREEVRDAVNRVAHELHLVCIKSNGYRYYRREQRNEIINKACIYLEAV